MWCVPIFLAIRNGGRTIYEILCQPRNCSIILSQKNYLFSQQQYFVTIYSTFLTRKINIGDSVSLTDYFSVKLVCKQVNKHPKMRKQVDFNVLYVATLDLIDVED